MTYAEVAELLLTRINKKRDPALHLEAKDLNRPASRADIIYFIWLLGLMGERK